MTGPTQELQQIIKGVQLESVRLAEVSAKSSVRSPGAVAPVELQLEWGAKFAERCDAGFCVMAPMTVRVRSQANKPATVVSISVQFEIRYSLDPQVEASDEGLNAFARVNGSFNAWPYCRALIQSLSSQMNIPPITIPVFRVDDALKGGADTAAPAERARGVSGRARKRGARAE